MKLIEDYKVITITHHHLNVDEIGHFMIKNNGADELKGRLDQLMDNMHMQELIYLSTCNRVSFIFISEDELTKDYLQQLFSHINPDLKNETLDKIDKYVTVYTGLNAINHVYEVASSMDSLVVGEREIFRQLREAYAQSRDFGHIGENLRLLDKFTVTAAKEVYEKTKIGEKPLSIVSLAVQELYTQGIDQNSRILMVGAGETNTLMAKFLTKKKFDEVAVFNRSLDNASHICDMLGGKAYHLSELSSYNKGFDVLIVCTAATEPIITSQVYRSLIQREDQPKIVIDLSVPANVAPDTVAAYPMKYIDIEGLRTRAEANLDFRKQELVAARKLLRSKLIEFQKAHQQRQLEMLLHLVPKEIKAVKQHALSNVYAKKLEQLDDSSKALVLEMMDYMEKKCISVPMKAAKELI